MITHFQWKPLFKQANLPGWRVSFYFKGNRYDALYHKNGEIEWEKASPAAEDEEAIRSQIHELMLFHVYDG
ncbi:YheE family protein [Metabacillus sp. cB07]|uniref:YheE family protein n=1 Tax=Metabacillus sp. cB07 TaxID=2806989 RepID=UPI00193AAAFE|nr:YheE family protein [Metabacillus sp. cB07]